MGPSSAILPLGRQPPCGMPWPTDGAQRNGEPKKAEKTEGEEAEENRSRKRHPFSRPALATPQKTAGKLRRKRQFAARQVLPALVESLYSIQLEAMETSTIALIALGILVLCAIAFFAVFRGKGKLQIKGPGVSLKAEGENPPPPAAVAAGVRMEDAKAGQNIRAHATGPGGVELEKVKAKGDIDASSSPIGPSPKA